MGRIIRPVPGSIRIDPMGDGHFMAPRGSRLHCGIDIECIPDEHVLSPMNGIFKRIARPYVGLDYSGVLIESKNLWIKMFYFLPDDSLIGKELFAGQIIGRAQDISLKHSGGMLPHIHLETIIPALTYIDQNGLPSTKFIHVNPELFL